MIKSCTKIEPKQRCSLKDIIDGNLEKLSIEESEENLEIKKEDEKVNFVICDKCNKKTPYKEGTFCWYCKESPINQE